ncbi:MAG TPA: hypothetical protein PKE12_11770 [Kiritimatiellia bacterium]|nr:hypothetical protein [Kiritimatiellia bacterium]
MALTSLQRIILRTLAAERINRNERYVAGGVALNTLLAAARRSRDIDLFHDTDAALSASWTADRKRLEREGFELHILREAPAFVEALVGRDHDRTVIQWTRDSAFRFFPLIEDETLGLTLHPFDLATNKVLAMAGRLEVRDWIDVLTCDAKLQPLGYLTWAACGKDPGFNPRSLLAQARRLHYSQQEVGALDFDGDPPDAAEAGRRWHAALEMAGHMHDLMPAHEAGACVITTDGELFRETDPDRIARALRDNRVAFHHGSIRGAWPQVMDPPRLET